MSARNRNLNQLGYFHVVAQCGSVSEAARRLSVTPPTVSVRLAALERELGEPLFDRVKGRLVLNAAGRRAFDHTSRILDEVEALFRSFGFDRNESRPTSRAALLKEMHDIPRPNRSRPGR